MAADPARAKSLFLAASDLFDPADRDAYLDRECGDDAELRGRVEALLRANDAAPIPSTKAGDGTGAFVPDRRAQSEDHADPTAGVGSILGGKYKLIEEIGEGGMGSVFMAQQTEPVKRAVAVKVIKAGMDSKAVLTRFEAERQALAMMDHPNIAKVLDAGTTDGGRPYFVMELVKGLPITQFCDERKLTPRQRLELFLPVCEAIQHAHQKGVIHRDIKPSNVLIAMYDDRPVPKVIDFGVAKAAAHTLTDRTLMTGFGAVVGTPEYMSPEQANLNNLDVDTRSDVYSLGVLLYELLTGGPPFTNQELEKQGLLEMLRVVREVEPPRPSTRLSTAHALPSLSASRGTEPKKLTGLLRNELDWIVMKALEKDRARRYETVNSFAMDVNRYLAGEAVQAHPPSAAYRLKKFVRRNRPQVIAASLVLLALLAGIAGTTWQAIRAERARAAEAAQRAIAVDQRIRAEKARDRTRDVLDAMTSSATGDALSTQHEISENQKTFLTEVLTYYREFAGEEADDEQTRARTANAAYRVGLIESRLGRKEQGIAALQKARDDYRTLVADFPAVPGYQQGLANSHNNLGILLKEVGKLAEAQEQYQEALAIKEKLAADFPAVPGYRKDLAGSHNNLGNLLAGLGKPAEAEQQYRNALTIQESLAANFPAVPGYRKDLAGSHNNLGVLMHDLGKSTEAEQQYRQALAVKEKLAADFPTVPAHRQALASSHNNLGILMRGLGKPAEAEQQYRQALTIQESLAADFPTVPSYRRELARSHHNLGILLANLRKPEEAEGTYRQALAIRESLAADFPTVPEYRQELASSHDGLGDFLAGLGKPVEAQEQYRMAFKEWDRTMELSPPAEQLELRASRATSRLRAGMVAEAVAEVAELTRSPDWDAVQWYNYACVYAVASGKILDKEQEYADRAMELLHKAAKAGYADAAHMAIDSDLVPLRGREDFKLLIGELEKGMENK